MVVRMEAGEQWLREGRAEGGEGNDTIRFPSGGVGGGSGVQGRTPRK